MLIIYLLSFFYPLINGEQTLNCGDWDAYKDEKCYKVFDNTYVQNYTAARITCSQYETASLLSIHSNEEQEFLINLIYNVHKTVNDVWIGADYKNNSFHWSNNVTINYTNWANEYPVSGDYECVSLSFSSHGKWMNEPCVKMNSIVCQKEQNWLVSYLQHAVMELRVTNENLSIILDNTRHELQSTKSELDYYKSELKHALTNASTGCSLSKDWVKCDTFVDFRTNKRQVVTLPKLLTEKNMTQGNALNACKKYNSTLVSIESVEKQLFLQNFLQTDRAKFWSSGYSSSQDRKWRWINGHELAYTNWAQGQPDNGYPNEPCLEINYDGHYKWNDVPCTSNAEPFAICEFEIVA